MCTKQKAHYKDTFPALINTSANSLDLICSHELPNVISCEFPETKTKLCRKKLHQTYLYSIFKGMEATREHNYQLSYEVSSISINLYLLFINFFMSCIMFRISLNNRKNTIIFFSCNISSRSLKYVNHSALLNFFFF